jgi:hypothetical protein
MRIRLGVSPDIDTDTMGEAIDAALEAVAVSQVPLIKSGKVPDIRDVIEAGKVRWKPEPKGDEHFDDAKTVIARGWGDCDDLAPWLAATLRATGEAPNAYPYVYQSGPRRWHAVVDDGHGKMLDPSRWAGMGKGKRKNSVSGHDIYGTAPVWSPMFGHRLAIASHPHTQGWSGRVDVPDTSLPITWSTVAHGYSPHSAVAAAVSGACDVCDVAGEVDDTTWARLVGLETLLEGATRDEAEEILAEELGEDYVGILPMLAPAAAQFMMSPQGQSLMSKIPGGMPIPGFSDTPIPGVPIPVPGFSAAKGVLKGAGKLFGGLFGKKKKKKRRPPPSPTPQLMAPSLMSGQGIPPGATVMLPGGAIIVRF